MSKDVHETENELKKINLKKTGNGYKLEIDYSGIGKRLDIAQTELDKRVWRDVQQYMPHKNGTLKSATNALNETTRGKVYLYPYNNPNVPYGHYQHEGVKYVDPVYGYGGFQLKNGEWRSRKEVKKVPSNQKLKYTDPKAQSHWGEYAYQQHSQQWLDLVKRILGK